ncbi:MAG: tripartite tricarboxylate transporter substrate binding protein [Rhodopseudomonas sp.]|nr:tripartite tricarboxylate transporter substrate binding protein [Rhodopseudomonas sp.]
MSGLNRRTFVTAGAAAALTSSGIWSRAQAAGFPERPITIIYPYGAGGSGDVVLRMMQPILEKQLGQSVIIETRPGGGGNIGAHAVAQAKPDGYTLLLGATNNFVINQFLFKSLDMDPLKAFALVTRPSIIPSVFYTNATVPARTMQEFIAYAKGKPGKLNYASPGVGTTPHLSVERLKQIAGIDLVHVPYRGAPAAMQALLTNDVQLYLAGYGVGRAFVEQGKVRMLAVGSERRLPALPDVPTTGESGLAGYTASNWWGLAAPKGTPAAVIDKVYAAFKLAAADKAVKERLEKIGFLAGDETPAAFTASAAAEASIWEDTIRKIGLYQSIK